MIRTIVVITALAIAPAFAADLAPKKPVDQTDKTTTEKSTTETTTDTDIDKEHKGQDPKKELIPVPPKKHVK